VPAPTTYSEDALRQFQLTTLGPLAGVLGWTSTVYPAVVEAANDALLAYPAATIADATNVPRLRALARVAIWRAVARETAGNYRFSTDGQAFDRQQIHEHALAMVAEAEREGGAVGAGPAMLVASVVRDDTSDPYAAHPSQWGGTI
jgi:hypothetical protein